MLPHQFTKSCFSKLKVSLTWDNNPKWTWSWWYTGHCKCNKNRNSCMSLRQNQVQKLSLKSKGCQRKDLVLLSYQNDIVPLSCNFSIAPAMVRAGGKCKQVLRQTWISRGRLLTKLSHRGKAGQRREPSWFEQLQKSLSGEWQRENPSHTWWTSWKIPYSVVEL